MRGMLALEDGTLLEGEGFGAQATVVGEVVFNTSMTGYQEILTDPSYYGQMVAMTVAHVGNVGVNPEDVESRRPWVQAFIVREVSPIVSNWRAVESLPEYLARHGIPGLSEVEQAQQFLDAAFHLLSFDPIQIADEAQQLSPGQLGVQVWRIGHIAGDGLSLLRLGLHIEVADPNLSGAGLQQADDHLDGRRFTGAVGAQEAEDFAAVHLQADIVNSQFFAIFLDQAAGCNQGHRGCHIAFPCRS